MNTELLTEVRNDLKEVKLMVIDLVKQGAIHNQILLEHEKRSTQLETRLTPMEADYSFRNRLFTLSVSLIGVAGGILSLLKYLKYM